MFVPSVTKYNEIYMPDIERLEKPHRMANITYRITDTIFSNNGKSCHVLWTVWFTLSTKQRDQKQTFFMFVWQVSEIQKTVVET